MSTTPASVSASAAPVGSLNADSAITVCASLGFSRERTNSGIRIAGSVGDSTAPTRKAMSHGRSNAKCAVTPDDTRGDAASPGTASSTSVTQTPAQHRQRERQPAVEEDQRYAEREDQLRAERIERHVDHVERRRARTALRRHQHQDLRDSDQRGDEARQQRAHQQQAQRQEEVVGHSRTRWPSIARRAMSAGRHEQEHDHEPRAQPHRDQPAAGVLARVVERLLRRRGAARLVAGELVRAARHLVEQAQLRARGRSASPRVVATLKRRVRLAVELHELAEARRGSRRAAGPRAGP